MSISRFLATATSAFLLGAMAAHSAPDRDYSEYTHCKPGEKDERVRDHAICYLNERATLRVLGTIVEGNQSLRRVAEGYRWVEFVSGEIVHENFDIVFDCKRNSLKRRAQTTVFNGSSIRKDATSAWEDKDTTDTEIATMAKYCPIENGFIRIGEYQLKIKDAMRSRSVVNALIKTPKGEMKALSVDCDKLLMTIGKTARAIRPESYGQEIFSLLCKKHY